MQKLVFSIACVILFLSGCQQPNSPATTSKPYFDPSDISTKNNASDSDISITNYVYSRKSSGSGIVGTWFRCSEDTIWLSGEEYHYHSFEKTDYFYSDGTYKVVVTKQKPVTNGFDVWSESTKGTYSLTINADGSYQLITTDSKTTSVYSFLVSDTYLSITSK